MYSFFSILSMNFPFVFVLLKYLFMKTNFAESSSSECFQEQITKHKQKDDCFFLHIHSQLSIVHITEINRFDLFWIERSSTQSILPHFVYVLFCLLPSLSCFNLLCFVISLSLRFILFLFNLFNFFNIFLLCLLIIFNRILESMIRFESQIKIENQAKSAHCIPRQRNVKWCWLIQHVFSFMREFIWNEYLRKVNEKCYPSAFSRNRIVNSCLCTPSGDIHVSFFECKIRKKKPDKESIDIDQICGRNPKRIDQEESTMEIDYDGNPNGNHESEMPMAAPDFPLSVILCIFSSKPIILLQTKRIYHNTTYFSRRKVKKLALLFFYLFLKRRIIISFLCSKQDYLVFIYQQ